MTGTENVDSTQRVQNHFLENIAVHTQAAELLSPAISRAGDLLATVLLNDRKILACGNGGCASIAQYFAALMVNRFEMERPGLSALALTPDSAMLTSIADDYQFADVFSRQIRALSSPGDILLAISSNGNSSNLVHALDAAHDRHMRIIALSGHDGGRVGSLLAEDDVELRVPSFVNARIQETHMTIIHSLCDQVDRHLLGQEE